MPENFFNSARISQQHLAIALSQVKLGFWELDLKTKTIECTAQNRVNFGFSMSQLITEENIVHAILPEDRWRRTEAMRKAMNPDTPTYDFEIRVKHSNQRIRWLQVYGTVIFEGSTPVQIIGTTVDISDKKGIEILHDELLNIATHELKSPLSVVKGYLQLLSKFIARTGDSKHVHIAERALSANGKIERLIGEIIDTGLHSQSEMLLKKELIDVRELIFEVVENTKLTNTGTEIQCKVKTDRHVVFADKYRIAQVLTNLINNALKYSPGEKMIGIELSDDDLGIRVSVLDRGIGIAEHERKKIFEKFYRIESSSRLAPGSGIGLYLCSEIIARHNGTICIESNPSGKGSLVFFNLPL